MLNDRHLKFIAEAAAFRHESSLHRFPGQDDVYEINLGEDSFFAPYDIGAAAVDAYFDDPGVVRILRTRYIDREEIQTEIAVIREVARLMVDDCTKEDARRKELADYHSHTGQESGRSVEDVA